MKSKGSVSKGFVCRPIDTTWISKNQEKNQWKGRVCRVYSKTGSGWKLTMHTDVLEYQ